MIEILLPSPDRTSPKCALYGTCGGCQYQGLTYESQLIWKQQQVENSLVRLGGISVGVNPVVPSPKTYGYRSKLTPHYQGGKNNKELTVGFLKQGSRKMLVDVPQCPIATDSINETLPRAREELKQAPKKSGWDSSFEVMEGVVTDPKQFVSEKVGDLIFHFKAGEFFQNNPFILPKLVDYVVQQADGDQHALLVDAYCGGGLFRLSAASHFDQVVGIEVSREGFEGARTNAQLNNIKNAQFFLGDASSIFHEIKGFSGKTAVVIDPPRRGCDRTFFVRLSLFRPIVLFMFPVSCHASRGYFSY